MQVKSRWGQLPIAAIVTGGITLLLAGVGSFFGLNNKVGSVETRTAVIEAKYEIMSEKLEKIDFKLDTVLGELNPKYKPQSLKINTSTKNGF